MVWSIVISSKCFFVGQCVPCIQTTIFFFCLREDLVTTAFQMAYHCSLINSLPISLWQEEMRSGYRSPAEIFLKEGTSVSTSAKRRCYSLFLWLTVRIRGHTVCIPGNTERLGKWLLLLLCHSFAKGPAAVLKNHLLWQIADN